MWLFTGPVSKKYGSLEAFSRVVWLSCLGALLHVLYHMSFRSKTVEHGGKTVGPRPTFNEIQQDPTESNGSSNGIQRKLPTESHGIHRNRTESHGIQRNPTEPNRIQQKLTKKIRQTQRNPTESNADSTESQRRSN